MGCYRSQHIALDIASDIPADKYSTLIYLGGTITLLAEIPGHGTSWTDPVCRQPGTFYQIYGKYDGETASQNYSRISATPVNHVITEWPQPVPLPIGTIKGKVETLSGAAVSDLMMVATLLNPDEIENGDCWPPTDTVFTAQFSGNYTFDNLYWGNAQDTGKYEIRPVSSDPQREFLPDSQFVRLYTSPNNIITEVNFTDITSYSVSGTVRDFEGCGLDDVQVRSLDGSAPPVITDLDGTYTFVVPENIMYDLEVAYQNIPFDTLQVNVATSLENIDFVYTHFDTIQGFVGGGCFEFLGQAEITVRGQDDCIIKKDTTDSKGFYEMVLPKRELDFQVSDYFPLNSTLADLNIYPEIDSIYEVELDSLTEINIVYRKPLTMDIIGIPAPPCPSMPFPVMNQGENYLVQIVVWESVGVCLADTGSIVIQNDISTTAQQSPRQDTIPFSNGLAQYVIRPGEPALVAPYTKNLTIKAIADNQQTSITKQIVVSGSRQRTGTFYTTAPKTLPLMILRDPPGDNSRSWFNESTTVEYVDSYQEQLGGGGSVWASMKSKVGDENVFQVWGQVAGKLTVQTIGTTANSETHRLTTTQEISTSTALTGTDGDVIMYGGVNFRYGLTDDRIFDINTCSIKKDTSIAFSPDNLAEETTAIRSVRFVKDEIIPDLELLASNSNITEEQKETFLEQINLWEQTLQLNEQMKLEALRDNGPESFTIDAGVGPTTSSRSGSSTHAKTISFSTVIDAEVALNAGIKTKMVEAELGFSLNLKKTFGGSDVTVNDTTWNTGYTFDDDDVVLGNESATIDDFEFKVAIDSVFGVPVFSKATGKSSCPHEEGMQQVDLTTVSVANPNVYVPFGDVANFTFFITNISESNDDRDVRFDVSTNSNALGATITIGGLPVQGLNYFINSGSTQMVTVQVIRPEGSPYYQYEGLKFRVYNPCDFLVRKEIEISAYFENDCSDIVLSAPSDDWLINQDDNNIMSVEADNYTIDPSIDLIKLTYKPATSDTFQSTNISVQYGDLIGSPAPQSFDWDVSNIPDGEYVIRWEIHCGSTINFSQRRRGLIDRTPPRVFGSQLPTDNLFFPGDNIMAQFTEQIALPTNSTLEGFIKTNPQGVEVPSTITVTGDSIFILPSVDISGLYGQEYQVNFLNVSDLHGNAMSDTVDWFFTISEPDTDRDGVPDTKDRCPGGDDMADSDMGGLPDDCDCSPLDDFNDKLLLTNNENVGLDFDGVNDQISIATHPDLMARDTQSLTIEAWIKPDDVSGFQSIVSSATNLSFYNFAFYLINDKLRATAKGGVILQSQTSIVPSEWTHVAIVFDADSLDAGSSKMEMYINGEHEGTLVDNFNTLNYGNAILVGNINGADWEFDGKMDEVRIWRSVRSQYEIQGFMNQQLKGNEQNLVVYYDFNQGIPNGDNSGIAEVEDQSIFENHGTLFNFQQTGSASNWTPGEVALLEITFDSLDLCRTCPDTVNAAMDFTKKMPTSTVHPYISIPYNTEITPSGLQGMTFEAWIKPTALTVGQSLIANQRLSGPGWNFLISLNTNQKLAVTVNNNGYFSTGTIPLNTWTHIAVEFFGTELTIVINGNLDLEASPIPSLPGSVTTPINISSQFSSIAFQGQMDDIRFWNVGRSVQEIKDNFLTELKGDEPGLFAYYNFNHGLPNLNNTELTVVEDATTNGNDATIHNFAQSGPNSNWVKSPLNFPDTEDDDGIPDVCDNCFNPKNLFLDNSSLNGVYDAREKIILGSGVTIPNNAILTFRAPFVQVSEFIQPPSSATIIVKPVPCED